MKTIAELLPLAIGVALVGALTVFLLDRNATLGRWLLAGLLFAHGWVHMMFVFPKPEPANASSAVEWPFDFARSWLISGAGLDAALIRSLGIVLMVSVLLGFVFAAMSTVGILIPVGWWAGLLVASSAVSFVMLAVFASPAFLIGFAINIALIVFVFAAVWSPTAKIP